MCFNCTGSEPKSQHMRRGERQLRAKMQPWAFQPLRLLDRITTIHCCLRVPARAWSAQGEMDVTVVDIGSRFIRAGKADPFPNDQEPWVVSPGNACGA